MYTRSNVVATTFAILKYACARTACGNRQVVFLKNNFNYLFSILILYRLQTKRLLSYIDTLKKTLHLEDEEIEILRSNKISMSPEIVRRTSYNISKIRSKFNCIISSYCIIIIPLSLYLRYDIPFHTWDTIVIR